MKRRGGTGRSFADLWDEEPQLAQGYFLQTAAGAIAFIAGCVLALRAGSIRMVPVAAFVCLGIAGPALLRVRAILAGKVSVYEGTVTDVENAGVRHARLRTAVTLRTDGGLFVRYFPQTKNDVPSVGDAVTLYAHDSAFSEAEPGTCVISGYYHVRSSHPDT